MKRLAVGIHHKAVRETLAALLEHHKPLQMSDENAKVKDEIEWDFKTGKSRLTYMLNSQRGSWTQSPILQKCSYHGTTME